MKTAEDLDEVIKAHKHFLDVIVTRCLLDPHSQVISSSFVTITLIYMIATSHSVEDIV